MQKKYIKKARSAIWDHYTMLTPDRAECDMCHKELSSQGGTTTNLHRHLKSQHPTVELGVPVQTSPTAEAKVLYVNDSWVMIHDGSTTNLNEPMKTELSTLHDNPSGTSEEHAVQHEEELPSNSSFSNDLLLLGKGVSGKRSAIWNYFTVISSNKVKCNKCDAKLYFGKSTTNLIRHMKAKHRAVQIPCTYSSKVRGIGLSVQNSSVSNKSASCSSEQIRETDRKRSAIWKYFTSISPKVAACDMCHAKLCYRAGTTTNLHRHMKTKHQIDTVHHPETSEHVVLVVDSTLSNNSDASVLVANSSLLDESDSFSSELALPGDKPKIVNTIGQNTYKIKKIHANIEPSLMRLTPYRPKPFDIALLRMIVKDYQPFSVVEDTGFKSFAKLLNPSYDLPDRNTLIQSFLPQIYEKTILETKQKLHTADSFCLTTDSWTSSTSNSYIAITCHFVNADFAMESCLLECFSYTDSAESLKDEFLRVATEWEITDKIVAVVTENDENIVAAVNLTGWNHLPCFAHTLNSIVQESLKSVKPTIEKVKSIVEFIHSNPIAADKLRNTQTELSIEELTLKQDLVTCWNTTYYMLEQFYLQKDGIETTIEEVNPAQPMLSSEEWDIVKEVCEVLQPLEEVMKEISSEKSVSASKVIIMARGIQKLTFNRSCNPDLKKPVQEMVYSLQDGMALRFSNIEYQPLFAEASIMDPRFKNRAFTDQDAAEVAVNNIISCATCEAESTEENETAPTNITTEVSTAMFWEDFDSRVSDLAPAQTATAEASKEVRSYIEEPLLSRNEDPFIWWKERCVVYKRLIRVMKAKLCIVATSVPFDRIFETCQTITERRNRLSPSLINEIVFLHENMP